MRTLALLALTATVATGCPTPPPQLPVQPAEPAPPPETGPEPARPALPFSSVAVLPIRAKGKADPSVLEVLDDLLLTALYAEAGGRLRVVGKSDIDAALGFEKTKDALGCDEISCAAEIAGALGVDSIISATAGTLGKRTILTLAWIDQQQAEAVRRHSENLGTSAGTFDAGVRRAVVVLLGGKPTAPAVGAAEPPPEAANPLLAMTFDRIEDQKSGMCLDIRAGARRGEPLRVAACADVRTRFTFVTEAGTLRLRDRQSGRCVRIPAKASPGDQARLGDCADTDTDWQIIEGVSDGQPVNLLRDDRSGYCLEVANDARAGDVVRVWECSATDTQFRFH